MIISARYVKNPKWIRYCDECRQIISGPMIRLYGAPGYGDKPYNLYLHLGCINNNEHEPKIKSAVLAATLDMGQ